MAGVSFESVQDGERLQMKVYSSFPTWLQEKCNLGEKWAKESRMFYESVPSTASKQGSPYIFFLCFSLHHYQGML